ncbi:MAG: hypothetical protein IPN29_15960 [Saprospiraceae bacterium]|nr:hypothetical protein [Saprospiraceae bacterium]
MSEVYLYAFPSFIIISCLLYAFRGYSFTRGAAIVTLFFTIYIGIFILLYAFDDLTINEDKLDSGAVLYTKFNGEAFVAQYIKEYPLIYLFICIFLTYIFKEFYFRLLKLKSQNELVENKTEEH